MEKINMEGKVTIKTKVESPLQTAIEILSQRHKSAFDEIHPMVELIFKTLNEVKTWPDVK